MEINKKLIQEEILKRISIGYIFIDSFKFIFDNLILHKRNLFNNEVLKESFKSLNRLIKISYSLSCWHGPTQVGVTIEYRYSEYSKYEFICFECLQDGSNAEEKFEKILKEGISAVETDIANFNRALENLDTFISIQENIQMEKLRIDTTSFTILESLENIT